MSFKTSANLHRIRCLTGLLACVVIGFTAPVLRAQETVSDPTQPSQSIADRMRVSQVAPLVASQVVSMDPLPKLRVKAIVLRDALHGTAWIEHEGDVVRVNLNAERKPSVNSITPPSNQFKPDALDRLESDVEEKPAEPINFDDLVEFGNRWMRIKAFNSRVIVFESLPDSRLIFAR